MTIALIGIGANLGDPVASIREAFSAIAATPGCRMLNASSLYRTAPIGGPTQPDYINAAARIDTSLIPRTLLDTLLGIEREHGRERGILNGPRTLDLDLLLYGDSVLNEPGLIVPHPRMHERRFVLEPLLEIDPVCVIPGRGTARQCLAGTDRQAVERMA